MAETIRLGLIGGNIAASQSPKLHRLAGRQNGRVVTYDLLIPRELGLDFDAVFDRCRAEGFRGLNITYPHKEQVTARVEIPDPLVRAIGAVNTVLFEPDGPKGWNTDHTGFMAAYRGLRGDVPPGTVLMIGAGGVGKAVGFGLARLGATEIRIADVDRAKADALAAALKAAVPALSTVTGTDAVALARGADGLVNGTPIGMVGYGGTPLPRAAMAGAAWAFDAVYTPVDTQFLQDAAAEGLGVLSGYELFFHQGVDAWRHFTGLPLDEARLRDDLLKPE